MTYRVRHAEAVRYPIVRVTFDDGLTGEYDMGAFIGDGPMYQSLKDESYFRTVSAAPDGLSFGWNLAQPGEEIDFCPDAARIAIETQIVENMAARYRLQRSAAE